MIFIKYLFFCLVLFSNINVFGYAYGQIIFIGPCPDASLSIDNPPILPDNPPLITEITCPVIYGEGRQLSVCPYAIPGGEQYGWHGFPWNEPVPPTQDQSTIVLTESDPLMIVVPMFGYQPLLAAFDTQLTRTGNQLQLDGYTLWSGGMTETMYGPIEFLKSIGSLPAGHYTLNVRKYFALDTPCYDMSAFKSDPEAYAYSHNVHLDIITQTLDFTVVPEPSVAILLGFGFVSLIIKRMIKKISFVKDAIL